jgi:hypothetical protein
VGRGEDFGGVGVESAVVDVLFFWRWLVGVGRRG